MNARYPRRISRNTAEQLLSGHAGPDQDTLTRVLAAASAPATEHELTGEQIAVAAFEANRLVTVATPQKEQKSMLARILTTKVFLTSVAVFATGGVAFAASTTMMPNHPSSQAASAPTATRIAATASAAPTPGRGRSPIASPSPRTSTNPRTAASPSPVAASPTPSTAASAQPSTSASTKASLPQTAAGLCEALISAVNSAAGANGQAQVQALASSNVQTQLGKSEFSSLVSVAQSAGAVPDYCALLLDLPQLPGPSELASLPGPLLGQLLSALPTSTLAQVLTSLPTQVLGQTLLQLPNSALSTVLTTLPTSTAAQLLNSLPTTVLHELPVSVLSQLPTSILSGLSTTVQNLLGL
jgi:hypothetical protein